MTTDIGIERGRRRGVGFTTTFYSAHTKRKAGVKQLVQSLSVCLSVCRHQSRIEELIDFHLIKCSEHCRTQIGTQTCSLVALYFGSEFGKLCRISSRARVRTEE